MLRTTLLFVCLLGFFAADLSAAAAPAAAPLIHRRKPTAGNYRPVYKTYRHHSRRRNGIFSLFKRHTSAPKVAGHVSKSRGHRGTL